MDILICRKLKWGEGRQRKRDISNKIPEIILIKYFHGSVQENNRKL